MINKLDPIYGQGNYTFMQDGAPAHKCALTTLYLKKRCSFLNCWPANSPDLNPIEHLWGAMKRILKTKKVSTKDELIKEIYAIWGSFSQESINNLVKSFRDRLQTVIEYNGESITDILRSRIFRETQLEVVPDATIMPLHDMITACDPTIDDNPLEFRTKRPWSIEEDLILLKGIKELGLKWTQISQRLTDRTPLSCRNRYMHMKK